MFHSLVGTPITITMLDGKKISGTIVDSNGDMIQLEIDAVTNTARVKKYLMIVVEPDGHGGYREARSKPEYRSTISMEVFDPNA